MTSHSNFFTRPPASPAGPPSLPGQPASSSPCRPAQAAQAARRPARSAGADPIKKLSIIVPANPGGGWDQTGRAMQQDLQSNKLVSSAQVSNIGGGGGTNGLAKLATEKDVNTLMVMGYVMVGAVETNGAKTRLEDTTPIARLTEEPLVLVVPASSKYQSVADLVADIKANGKGVAITGGSAGGADHILAGPDPEVPGRGSRQAELHRLLRRRRIHRGAARQQGPGRHLRRGRVRRTGQGRQGPGARRLRQGRGPGASRAQAAQGPGDRRRADQLARRGGHRVHRRRPDERS